MDHDTSHFLDLPPELVVKVFEFLPSFSAAFTLTATCRRLRRVWNTHKAQIYVGIATTSIECEPYARQLLADQGGAPLGSPLSDRDIIRIAQNLDAVNKAVVKFQENYAATFRTRSIVGSWRTHLNTPYGSTASMYKFTPTERLRFVRAWYQISSLLALSPDETAARVAGIRPRASYYAYELLKLDIETNKVFTDDGERYRLEVLFRKALQELWRKEYGSLPPDARLSHGSYEPILVIEDFYQYHLKSLICFSSLERGRGRGVQKTPKLHLWDDEPGDDRLIGQEEEKRKHQESGRICYPAETDYTPG